MGETTGISWAHHTFNPVWGCVEVSPGCDNCYARVFAHRVGFNGQPAKPVLWGADAARRTFTDKHWNEPLQWNRLAVEAGERRRVFCASMGDWAEDHPIMTAQLPRLHALWCATPALDWLMLTKRHGRITRCLPADWSAERYQNVWLGVSGETDEWFHRRVAVLREIPAVVRWVSAEPLLSDLALQPGDLEGIDWVIFGGESGPASQVRPMAIEWVRNGLRRCRIEGAVPFVKQLGSFATVRNAEDDRADYQRIADGWRLRTRAAKGDDPSEWPADLRVQEFPR